MMRKFKPALVLLLFILLAPQGPGPSAPLSLNGDWNFLADPQGKLSVSDLASASNVRPTRVPSSWQQQFTDLRDYAGVAWYWRAVTVDAMASQHVALLRFGAVDYRADVYVNGLKAGSHDGGYLPFEFDITNLLRAGENQIAVRVVDASAGLGKR
jgi:beta-galactosidase/beta-glucuronidase